VTGKQQLGCIVRLSDRQGDLFHLVHVAAGMTFSCLKVPPVTQFERNGSCCIITEPQRQLRCCPIARQGHRSAWCCAVRDLSSPLRYVAASDLLSAAGASAGAVKAQGIQAYCCSFHVLPVPNYPLQPSDITLQLPNKQPTCSPFLCLSFFIE